MSSKKNSLLEDNKDKKTAADLKSNFSIIGIGTSAGGLEALKLFFDNVPSDFEHTFVIVQHLSPDYKSLMVNLLSKNTALPIYEITNEMKVEPGSIYLIPPGKNMTLYQGYLRLTDKPSGHILNLPINIFFESLAKERQEEAIGIVLSGTGSDGSRGVRSIKEAGGMVIVQRPDTAAFDGMPNSAIATGVVDYVLVPEQMPDELIRYLNTPRELITDKTVLTAEEQVAFSQIMRLLKQQTDLDFSWYKRPTLLRRMQRRLTVNNCDNLIGYLRYLQTNPEESFVLYREFLIGVTHFFRDRAAWEILEKDVLPKMIREKQPNQPLKVWAVGCSSGEEAYTIGILLQEALKQNGRRLEIKIFATDVEKEHLDRAAQGIYPESIASDLSLHRLQTFFTKRGEQYQVIPDLRRTIIFSQHNALSDPPFGHMDMIICRNFMIYLQPKFQKRLIDTLHFALKKDGILFLGPSETLGDVKPMFEMISQRWRIYQNKELSHSIGHLRQLGDLYQPTGFGKRQQRKRIENHLADALNQAMLKELNAACVYVDEMFNIVHAIGQYKDYLELPETTFSTNLLDMVPHSLRLGLTTAVRKASRLEEQVTFTDTWRLPSGEHAHRLHLLVAPFNLPVGGGPCYLVLFMPGPVSRILPEETVGINHVERGSEETLILERTLKETQANLQAALEEAQTTNEELQATNEELMATNEELQSTNEELQSVNEELHTVNAEYQLKIDELAALNADIDNLLSSTQIGTIFLDRNLRIRRFTPAIQAQFDLLESDIGRPLDQLAGKFSSEDMEILNEHIASVLSSGQPKERELRTKDGHFYLKRIYPFINARQEIGGVVLTFVNTSQLKAEQQARQKVNVLFGAMFEQAPIGIAQVGLKGEWLNVNEQLCQIVGYSQEELIARTFQEITHPDDLEDDLSYVQQLLAGEINRYAMEKRYIKKDGAIVWINLTVSLARDQTGAPDYFVAMVQDLTTRKQAALELAASEEKYRALFNTMAQGVVYQNAQGEIILANPAAEQMLGLTLDQMQGRDSIDPRWRAIHEDGSDFPGETHPAMAALKTGKPIYNQIMGVYSPEKNGTVWLKVNAMPEFKPRSDTPHQVYTTFDDITQLKEQTTQLKAALAEIQQANKELEQFAYVASHDLQEPLNTVANFTDLLQTDYADQLDENGAEYLQMAHQGAIRMKALIKGLLHYSRLRKVDMDYERIDCKQMIMGLKDDLQDLMMRSGAEIDYHSCAEIVGDSRMLRQVMQNLITNAIKFRHPDVTPKIKISATEELDHWLIAVEDNGIGIAEKNHEDVFGIFRRLHTQEEYNGNGVGLALCKQIVTLHGGKIWLTSKPGAGSTFYFTIPKREELNETDKNDHAD